MKPDGPAGRSERTRAIAARAGGKRIAGYGAPGKGNTLLNYCGIRSDFVEYTVDRNPYKHGRFLPGTRIPILAPVRSVGEAQSRKAVEPEGVAVGLTLDEHYRTGGTSIGQPVQAIHARLRCGYSGRGQRPR